MKTKRAERGQVLVLVILALVGMFGFAALAIDGGRFFSERRRAQNAADAAAFAAAYAGINSTDYRAAGIGSTRSNGYSDTDAGVNTGVVEDVQVFRPPRRGRYATATETIDPNEYYQVIIRYKVNQVFSQIVYNGDLWVEVEAVARGTGHGGFGSDAAVVATCADCCPKPGLNFTGNSQITVLGGDVVSNSLNPGCDSADLDNAQGCVVIHDGNFISVGSTEVHASEKCPGDKLQVDDDFDIITNTGNPETYQYPHTPSCSGDTDPAPTEVNLGGGRKRITYSPGIYPTGIHATGNKTTVEFLPGMYCMDGDLSLSSGAVTGSNVMFYLRNNNASVNITTTGVTLSAPLGETNCIQDPVLSEVCWSSFLFFMPDENLGTISIAGGGDTDYVGTIYAPGPSASGTKCKITGGSTEDNGVVLTGSIICYQIDIAGGKGIAIEYDGSTGIQPTGSIEISE